MPLPQQRLTTLEEYEALPEDTRAEVFDGLIEYMASPSQDTPDDPFRVIFYPEFLCKR